MPRPLSIKRPDLRVAVELPLGAMATYPGAVAIIGRDGTPRAVTGGTAPIIDALQEAGFWPDLAASAVRTLESGAAAVEIFDQASPEHAIEVTFLPLVRGAEVFALFRPLAFESAFRQSLIESRQRYKDLSELAADFAWEADRDGCFSFVSPGGALGWAAKDMVGKPVDAFLHDPAERGGALAVFATHTPIGDAEIWLRRADGDGECVSVAAVPLFGRDGLWHGARGLCRAVTEERRRAREEAQGRLHDSLMAHLTRTIRGEIDPEQALSAALSATGLAIAASGAMILRGETPGELVVAAQWGSAVAPELIEQARAQLADKPEIDLQDDGVHLVGSLTKFNGRQNGGALLWREREHGLFSGEDRAVLRAAAFDPFGAALAQLVNHEGTLALSRTDPLTGLLNRRGFAVEATRRMARLARSPHPACLLYIDLDNFKLVNDTRGHQAGDAVLLELSRILHDNSRSGDLIARLGGDEFVMWLDGVSEATADRRAEAVLAQCQSLVAFSGDPKRPLGVSLGLAAFDPEHPEGVEELLARADTAMYRVKRRGGAGVIHAEPAAPESPPPNLSSPDLSSKAPT
ncbi:MAG: diguanylate cyclase [Alphaproteobacteria bacterium]|nr:diguanylate cyclase [Alphaproteobacteria bacterium]